MVEPLNEVHDSLQKQFHETRNLILVDEDSMSLDALKKKYKVKTNQELLVAIKPHPQSIALAQGALESAWGTSRFFKEANNIFGVWSFSKKDKRIAASSKRGKKTIWLKKYDTIKEAIEDYYLTTSRSKAFKAFKKLNYEKENQNPYLLVTKLDKYSEKGALYGKELSSVISFNNLTRFDEVHYTREKENRVIKE